MGLFRRAPTNDAEIEQLRTEMASLREALEQHGSSTFKFEGQLRALGADRPSADGAGRPSRTPASTSWPRSWPPSTPG